MKKSNLDAFEHGAPEVLRDRVDYLERELHQAHTHERLRRCFWTVFIIHAAPTWLFFETIEKSVTDAYSDASRWLVAVPLSGIGVLAVWYAWTNRTLVQRLSRALLAVGAIGLGCRVSYYSEYDSIWNIGLVASFALLGACLVSYSVTWLTRVALIPPVRNVYHRPPLSIKSIMLSMSAVAILFACARSMNYRFDSEDVFSFLVVMVCGMVSAAVTALVTVCAMRSYYLFLVAGLVAIGCAAMAADLMNSQVVVDWLWAGFLLGLLTTAAMLVLHHNGYELVEPKSAAAALEQMEVS